MSAVLPSTHMNNGQNGTSAMILGGPDGDLGGYATALAGPGPKRRLDREALADWVRHYLQPGEQRCTTFCLQRDDPATGLKPHAVATILPPKQGKKHTQVEEEEFAQQIVERFDRTATAIAEQYPRNSLFFVGACKTNDADLHPIDEFPFTVSPPPEVLASFHQRGEDVSLPSIVGTIQRHADTAIRSKDSNIQDCMNRMQEDLHFTKSLNRELMTEIFEMAKERNVLLDEQASRNIRVEKERLDMQLRQKLILDVVTGYLLPLAKEYVRARTGLTGAKVDSKVVETLASLEPTWFLKIVNLLNQLPDDQREAFAPVLRLVQDSMSQEQKNKMMAAAMADAETQAALADGDKS